jgi:sulfur relay (sulfurtransferase) complex TusBCD TusD component (DsrE family)
MTTLGQTAYDQPMPPSAFKILMHNTQQHTRSTQSMKKRSLIAIVLSLMLSGITLSTSASEEKGGLFVNLTTDDTWAAAKAILFAHEKVLKRGHKPVAIWLNVRGIYLADKKRPSHVHGLMKEQGRSIQDMLQAFAQDGGLVIACAACSKAAGLSEDDFIEGVQMGNPDLVMGLLFDPSVKTLSW